MALPGGFDMPCEYFRDVVNLLYEFKWLYVYPNTALFASKVLDYLPSEWRVYFQSASASEETVEKLGLGEEVPGAPASLNNFIRRVKALTPSHSTATVSNSLKVNLQCTKGLSLKKQHEIEQLLPLLRDYCRAYNIDYVIDVGCGLGYITKLLHLQGFKILGIDGNAKLIKTARGDFPQIPYEQLYVTSTSAAELKALLQKNFVEYNENVHRVCLVALHACADLTVDMLKLTLEMSALKMAVVMPCCYHRMKLAPNQCSFVHFPLSSALGDVLSCINEHFLNGTFLRLACQQANWKNQSKKEREVQTDNLMFRNLLQLVVDEEHLKVQRRRRKTGSHRGDYTIDSFLTNLASSYEIMHKEEGSHAISEATWSRLKLALRRDYERSYAELKPILAAYAALQNLLQPVCENLVLLDRCAFVAAAAADVDTQCITLKVTDECVSPRCFALVVTKSTKLLTLRSTQVTELCSAST